MWCVLDLRADVAQWYLIVVSQIKVRALIPKVSLGKAFSPQLKLAGLVCEQGQSVPMGALQSRLCHQVINEV